MKILQRKREREGKVNVAIIESNGH